MLIPLRVYTDYSLLKSTIKIEEAIAYCKENNLPYFGFANENNMFGILQWNLKLQKSKIKPILGCALKVNNGFVWAYCLNQDGYQELSQLISFSYLQKNGTLSCQDIYLKNCILICDSSLSEDEITIIAQNNNVNIAITRQKRFQEYENLMISISNKLNLPLVAAPLFFYAKKEQSLNADCLWCIKNGTYVAQGDRDSVNEDEYLFSQEKYTKIFEDMPFAIENSNIIAQKCNFLMKTAAPKMPKIGVENPKETFIKMARNGLETKMPKILEAYPKELHEEKIIEYKKRLEYELDLIDFMGFGEYFLIVADIINWAKQNDIPVGPGRGSAASSIVGYSLNITNIDPIRFQLMFERFLNPGRITMPDIDTDFCQENRHKIIEYIQQRFGKENVAHIITFGSLQYRAALRDIGRVLQMPYSMVDELCKKLPAPFQGVAPTLKELREKKISTEFINDENANLFSIAEAVEGIPRHSSVHAAGVVIGNEVLSKIVPLFKEVDVEMPITQFAMKDVDAIGLVKFDILGLAILSVIKRILSFIKRKGINLDINEIPLNDEKTFSILQKGLVKGVFQLDSLGFQNVIQEMKPSAFEDLIAAGALYRPGPMADIPMFIKCKHKIETPQYLFEEMESILEETYGVIVYQEQVLQIAKEIAGYSLKDADLLRRAMGKKIPEEMAQNKEKFINGVIEKFGKNSKEKAEQLFTNLARFAAYGFPKAHAAPYGLMTYQTAYLKANYTTEFFCGTFCYEIDLEKVEEQILEARKMGVIIKAPCINKSSFEFDIIDDVIFFGLSNIKGIGEAAKAIVHERNENGLFSSFENLKKRVSLNKKVAENLIYSGALDCFGIDRSDLFNEINEKENNNFMLFDFKQAAQKWDDMKIMQHEMDVLLTIFSIHLLKTDLKILKIYNNIDEIKDKGLVYCIGLRTVERKNKEGKTLFIYEFHDEIGVHKSMANHYYDVKFQKVVLEIEKFENKIYLKKMHKLSDFFTNYRKIFLKKDLEKEVLKLENGPTSIYVFKNDNYECLGDFLLNNEFLTKNKEHILSLI